eukprot:1083681-Pleurochrysis_carterae.AAC.1
MMTHATARPGAGELCQAEWSRLGGACACVHASACEARARCARFGRRVCEVYCVGLARRCLASRAAGVALGRAARRIRA